MILCIAVTIGFRDTKHIGNASGKLPFLYLASFYDNFVTFLLEYAQVLLLESSMSREICFLESLGNQALLGKSTTSLPTTYIAILIMMSDSKIFRLFLLKEAD